MSQTVLKGITEAAKIRAAEDPEFQQFFTLKEKQGRRSITDIQTVWNRCAEKGVQPEDFIAKTSIGLGSVKELVKAATGLKGKALDAESDAILHGSVKHSNPTTELVPVTKNIE
jgi:hypothetical protein